jgi:ABC-type multidrug transport system fused ATPase/permease subunit
MTTIIILGLALFLAIALFKVNALSTREEELQEQVNKLNRELWDLQTENLTIRSKIAEANDRAKTWELHANDLIQSRKNAQSSGRKGIN